MHPFLQVSVPSICAQGTWVFSQAQGEALNSTRGFTKEQQQLATSRAAAVKESAMTQSLVELPVPLSTDALARGVKNITDIDDTIMPTERQWKTDFAFKVISGSRVSQFSFQIVAQIIK